MCGLVAKCPSRGYLSPTAVIVIAIVMVMLTFLSWSPCSEGQAPERAPLKRLEFPSRDLAEQEACLAIIRGEVSEEDLRGQPAQNTLPESFYLNATRDCGTFIADRGYYTSDLLFSDEERNFPIAYSMVIHEKIEMFERLLRAIYAPQNVYCVHVDRKSPAHFLKAVEGIASCFPNVFLASKQESVVYASWLRVQADLNCMDDLLASPVKWKYLLNTCEADLPLKTNLEMVWSLKTLNGKNNLESIPPNRNKTARWLYHYSINGSRMVVMRHIRKDPPPISTPMFVGSAYFVLSRAFVEHARTRSDVGAFLEWAKDTYSPDEHIWATLQRSPSMPGTNTPHQRYDTEDMIAMARLVKWNFLSGDVYNGAAYVHCDSMHYKRGVCMYGIRDLRWMLGQHHLFANKFDPEVDDTVIKCLEHYLHFKATGHNAMLSFTKNDWVSEKPI
ncbi:beta-1,3-galactosyl-O-glycosyl-glycoprotein beta-1,6-N-acetylglucosaminyltransferase 3-like [Engraulis encrasicolus]|uniref:beta-1,3-galactosyl-O-glycosyl-glycoprotein beta-1,6-N-acetylglucosaminyltransferase 3-like n=1 Tax=Engraulis encrasicolus TaxID=184585 RepID=UPI002FD51DFA